MSTDTQLHQDAYQELYGKSSVLRDGQLFEIGRVDGKEVPPTEEEMTAITARADELSAEYDAQAYARNRAAEYPNLLELTVALYDTDDKAAIETKRAAVKAKWPKDNSGGELGIGEDGEPIQPPAGKEE